MKIRPKIIWAVTLLITSVGVGCSVQSAVNKPTSKVKTGAICPQPAPKKPTVSAKSVKTLQPHAVKPVVKKLTPRLLDLGATSCIPCKMMAPIIEALAKDYKGKLTVEFIDVWKNPSASDKYKISSIPTQIFFDEKGKEFYRHVGFFPKEDILKVFKNKGIKITK